MIERKRSIATLSLSGITHTGSKGMISARTVKAPRIKKKEKQPWKRVEFLSGTKIVQTINN